MPFHLCDCSNVYLTQTKMIRKITHYLVFTVVGFSAASCVEEEISAPPKPSFQASQSTAEVGEEITFTINHVSADAVSLLPYGLPGDDPGILLSNSAEGVVTVTFSYARPGTFQAIVVANNHSEDGEIVKNVQSEPVTITISSSNHSISAFAFDDLSTTCMGFVVSIGLLVFLLF